MSRETEACDRVHAAATAPPQEGRITTVSRVSLQTNLANALERNKRLASRVRQLEKHLAAMLGETAWTESGLGAAADIDQLQQRITMLTRNSPPHEANSTNGPKSWRPPAPPTAS